MPRWLGGLGLAALLAAGLLGMRECDGAGEVHRPPSAEDVAPIASVPSERVLLALAPRLASIARSTRDPAIAEGRIRALVKEALVERQDAAAASNAVRAALADERDEVRQAAWLAIGWYGSPDSFFLDRLVEDLEPERPVTVRRAAAFAAPYVDAETSAGVDAALIVASHDEDLELRRRAVLALGAAARFRDPPLDRLIDGLGDGDPVVREASAQGLARIEASERLDAERLRRIVPALAAALDDEREGVAHYAVMALGRTGAAMEPAFPRLLAALDDPRALVRANAATALAGGGPAALRFVRDALERDDGRRAEMLTWTLRLLGRDALAALDAAAKRPEDLVAVWASLRAWEVGHDDTLAVARLAPRLASTDPTAVLEAVRGLGRIGPSARVARPELEALGARLDRFGDHRPRIARALEATFLVTAR